MNFPPWYPSADAITRKSGLLFQTERTKVNLEASAQHSGQRPELQTLEPGNEDTRNFRPFGTVGTVGCPFAGAAYRSEGRPRLTAPMLGPFPRVPPAAKILECQSASSSMRPYRGTAATRLYSHGRTSKFLLLGMTFLGDGSAGTAQQRIGRTSGEDVCESEA
jgi:hypothetical protein